MADYQLNQHGQPTAPKRRGCFGRIIRWLLIAIGVIVVFVAGFITGQSTNTTSSTRTPDATPVPAMSADEAKTAAIDIDAKELDRNTENYVGDVYCDKGTIIQAVEGNNQQYQFRIRIGDDDVIIFAHHQGDRFLDQDAVEVCAVIDGRLTYDSTMGGQITVPEVTVVHMTLIAEE